MVMTKSRSKRKQIRNKSTSKRNKLIRNKSRSNKQIRKKSTSTSKRNKLIRNKSRSKKKQIIRKIYKKIDSGKEDEKEDEDLFHDNQIEVKEDLKYNDIEDNSVKDYIRKYLTTDGIENKIEDELYVISYKENIYLIDKRGDEIYKIFRITDIPYHEFLKK